ncbi:DUF5658 family protein [Tautonia sp. JC769]|uniref:DUF5658 family protein n=1 Tax=Tautonia sp. JC769 TaxID=3232135 RepID=UPI003459DF69
MSEHDRRQDSGQSAWHTRHLLLESEIAWLILLSVLDVFLTWALLARGPQFIESNPVAAWVFHRYNIKGLVAYKFLLIAGVVVIAEGVEYARAGRGKLVLRIGIIAAAAVVIYSGMLNLRHPF